MIPHPAPPLIYDAALEEISDALAQIGEPAFRAQQLWDGLYKNLWGAPQEFSNFAKPLREALLQRFSFQGLTKIKQLESSDGETTKVLFHTHDQRAIETVLMRYDKRRTLCLSTQSGCAMGCDFCATGQMGLGRNLSSGEIIEQALYFARLLHAKGESVTNIVMMGMGEPFHNYDATLDAIGRLNDERGFNLGARRFTVSTVGLVPGIRRFTQEARQVNLAVSLHAVDDALRSSMIPVNKKYPVDELLLACREYVAHTGRRITFEWALIDGKNDSPQQANDLASKIEGMLCHVNLIPLNPTKGYALHGSSRARVQAFKLALQGRGIPCSVRVRRGIDIYAGCGQLAN